MNMRLTYTYTVEGLGNTPIYEQAIGAAKEMAKITGKPVEVTRHGEGEDKTISYLPNGELIQHQKQKGNKMKAPNYYIVGEIYRRDGRCEYYCCGGAATLTGAKRMATRRVSLVHYRPEIYRAEDTELISSWGRITITARGKITTPDGEEFMLPIITTPDRAKIRVPKRDAEPIA